MKKQVKFKSKTKEAPVGVYFNLWFNAVYQKCDEALFELSPKQLMEKAYTAGFHLGEKHENKTNAK